MLWHTSVKGKRHYGCPQCGHTWQSKGRYPLWPISFFARWRLLTMRDHRGRVRWLRLLKWSCHWVEVGGDGPEQRVMMTIVQWLFIGIRFGEKQYKSPMMYVPDHGWYPRAMGEQIVTHLATQKEGTQYGYLPTYRKVDSP